MEKKLCEAQDHINQLENKNIELVSQMANTPSFSSSGDSSRFSNQHSVQVSPCSAEEAAIKDDELSALRDMLKTMSEKVQIILFA